MHCSSKNVQQNLCQENEEQRWQLLKENNYNLEPNSYPFPIDEKIKIMRIS